MHWRCGWRFRPDSRQLIAAGAHAWPGGQPVAHAALAAAPRGCTRLLAPSPGSTRAGSRSGTGQARVSGRSLQSWQLQSRSAAPSRAGASLKSRFHTPSSLCLIYLPPSSSRLVGLRRQTLRPPVGYPANAAELGQDLADFVMGEPLGNLLPSLRPDETGGSAGPGTLTDGLHGQPWPMTRTEPRGCATASPSAPGLARTQPHGARPHPSCSTGPRGIPPIPAAGSSCAPDCASDDGWRRADLARHGR